jgi:hypothetical protein
LQHLASLRWATNQTKAHLFDEYPDKKPHFPPSN